MFWRIRSHLDDLAVEQFSHSTPFSSIAFKREVPFRRPYILEEPSPTKVDIHRCHILDTKVDFFFATCLPGRFAVNY